jgi:hypothetical protein
MKAMLNVVHRHNQSSKEKINSVVCTGLGTFYGKMDLEEAARQMHLAYKCFMNPPKKLTWSFASDRQAAVGYGGYEGLKKVTKSAESAASRDAISDDMKKLAMETSHTNDA